LNKEDLAQQVMLSFANMRKRHTNYHSKAHTKRSEMAILSMLKLRHAKNGLKITEIGRLLHLPPSAITPVVDGLEKKGMVTRQNSPEDRRIVLVSLTKKGREFFDNKQKFFFEKSLRLVEYLGEEDSKEFIRLFNKAFEFMDEEFKKDQ
jgi:DNA-binding MarR family transcriptional regulator